MLQRLIAEHNLISYLPDTMHLATKLTVGASSSQHASAVL